MKLLVPLFLLASAGLVDCSGSAPAAVDVGRCETYVPVVATRCEDWDALYGCLGATERETGAMRWLRERESECGTALVNPRTSDIGDCQLNGVHGRPGWYQRQWWPEGWSVERFGLAPAGDLGSWRSNVDSASGVARVAAACLFLLRGSDDGGAGVPDAFAGCSNWRHAGWSAVCR